MHISVLIYFNNFNVFLIYKYSYNACVCVSKIDFYFIYIHFSCGLSNKMGKTTRTIFS